MTARASETGAGGRRPARSSEFAGRRVLVIDDDRLSIEMVREGLAEDGYDLADAHDGPSGLARVRDLKPDLVLLDVEMPGLSGVEVCRIVKANQSVDGFGFVPVILMTARGSTGKVEGLELGADDFLVKPFDPLELSARVRSMLRLKALQDKLLDQCRVLDQANRDLEAKGVELERLSRTDPLTALFNRRYFAERFAVEFSRSRRYRSPIVCAMIDIDHFKKVNDTLGHQAGDQTLREVAQTLKRSLRDIDLVARYGGEEFVVVLPETNPAEGRLVAERVRAAIEAHAVDIAGKPLKVTVSIGVANYPVPGVSDTDALLRAADDALYQAKARGRNRVHGFEEP